MKGDVKEFHLEAQEFRWEYTPGKWIHVWGYNGQIPGPTIRAQEGEKIRVIVKNSLPDATTVHWHGVDVPWLMDGVPGVTQKPIAPGAEFTYEFTATPSGTRWYHSHGKSDDTTAQQLDMGLSGAFIVEPKGSPRYAVDHEYTWVLDEWDVQNFPIQITIHKGNAGVAVGFHPKTIQLIHFLLYPFLFLDYSSRGSSTSFDEFQVCLLLRRQSSFRASSRGGS
jgi:hypothetical protein